ncbi:MAG: acylphosphatase [Deltaproteobacteria bacterium]|nr:acylphosphatase [Deltaproteobacteria bacterium]MCL5277355.1 acylphosphatase [Deltaproteobacteria bacterium]
MNRTRHVHLMVHGRVQGVWYRAGTRDTAETLAIKGWVRNLPDGSVEIDAWGEGDAMEKFIEWCCQGPPGARVTKTDIEELEPGAGPGGFEITG